MTGQLWGITPFTDSDGSTEFLSWTSEDIDIETDVAARRLLSLGFGTGDTVLIISQLSEAGYFAPFQRAARRLGGISCTAEASPFDAYRTAAYLNQFSLRATIGLDAGVLGGLEKVGDVSAMLRRCPWHVVRPDAAGAVRAAGIDPLALRFAGPAVAMECPSRQGAHLGRNAWRVSRSDEGITLAPVACRDLAMAPVHLADATRIETNLCGCGSDDPRLRFDADS
jgi:hypothetical protein